MVGVKDLHVPSIVVLLDTLRKEIANPSYKHNPQCIHIEVVAIALPVDYVEQRRHRMAHELLSQGFELVGLLVVQLE